MAIDKCPVCGGGPIANINNVKCCCECPFECSPQDIIKIAAAMELSECLAWRQEAWEATRREWPFIVTLRMRGRVDTLYDILDFAVECARVAEERVREVFK